MSANVSMSNGSEEFQIDNKFEIKKEVPDVDVDVDETDDVETKKSVRNGIVKKEEVKVEKEEPNDEESSDEEEEEDEVSESDDNFEVFK
jgi:hypothetical protein